MTLLVFAKRTADTVEDRGFSGERLLNYFLRPSEGVSRANLKGFGGLKPLENIGGPVRAILKMDGDLYAAANGKLQKVTTAGVVTELGSIPDGVTQISSNGTEVAVVVSERYYLWDGTTVAEYNTGSINAPKGIAYLDGYFIVIGETTSRKDSFTISGLNDGKTYAGLDIASAENAPDALTGVIVDHGEVWLAGTETIEVWYNSGGADFPFARNNGAIMEVGCSNGATLAKADNGVFWLGNDGIVYRSNGTTPEVISTREVEGMILGSTVEDGFIFTDRGSKFYALKLVGRPALVFDITTGLWVERGAGDAEWAACCSTLIERVYYVGCSDGNISTIDRDTYTDNGETLLAEATSIPAELGTIPQPVSRVEIKMRTGATALSDGRQPQVMAQFTRDGRTWTRELWRDLGKIGDTRRKILWNGNGEFERFQARFRVSDPVPRDIFGGRYE